MNSVFRTLLRTCYRLESVFDRRFLSPDVPMAKKAGHAEWTKTVLELGNRKGNRVLEVGSREVVAASGLRAGFSEAEYVGFDFYPGKNVDVVGDAHRLSEYFESGEKFDLVFSSACFEHFAMPWVAAAEMAKVLNVGGHVYVGTHFSYSSHERPWHFFHFTDMALRTLFSEALGFECIDAGMSNPIVGRFSSMADKHLRYRELRGMYCHSQYLGKKVREVPDFSWSQVSVDEVVGDTKYPAPQKAA